MTAVAANTPRYGAKGSKMQEANKNVIESRIIGVEVVCGPLDTHFIYYTVDLVGHGGNVMIEVLRQSKFVLSVVSLTSLTFYVLIIISSYRRGKNPSRKL